MASTSISNSFFRAGRPFLMIGLLAALVLACSLSMGGDNGVQQTQVAVSLQATIQAQQATQAALEQQNAQIAIQATQAALDRLKTEVALQASSTAGQATQPPSEMPTSLPASGELTPTAQKADSIPLSEFSGSGWRFEHSAQCQDRQKGCWIGMVKKGQVIILSGKEQVFLDPAWPFPHLVLWTRYKSFYGFTFGYVELDIPDQVGFARVQSFGGTRDYWERVYIPLIDYAGKTVAVRFYFQGPDGASLDQPSSFTWLVEDIQITPNFPER